MRFRFAILLALASFHIAVPVQASVVRDIGGDDKIGLEEAVYALQVAAEMREDDHGIGLESAIVALQIMTGTAPQGKAFPGSLSLFGSGLVFMAGIRKWNRGSLKKAARFIFLLHPGLGSLRNNLPLIKTKHAAC